MCLATGKFYIGGSKNVYKRNRDHIRELRHNRHHSSRLQNAWNKYGSDTFAFCVLETCSREMVGKREQWYLDAFRPFDRSVGYNNRSTISWNTVEDMSSDVKEKLRQGSLVRKISDSTRAKIKANWSINHAVYTKEAIDSRGEAFRIKSPTGEIFEGKGRRQFCRQHGLDHSQFARVLRGENTEVKGWMLPESQRQEPYRFVDPFGQEHTVTWGKLREFCSKHGLVKGQMTGVWTGRLDHHKGWCRADRFKDLYTKIIHQDGRVVIMCKRCYTKNAHVVGLHPVTFSKLMCGKRTEIQGWRLEPVS